jgi:magnesium-protoporphyrin O-methyltransferase
VSGCCSPRFYGKVFTRRTAERYARKYRRRGLQGTERETVEWLTRRGVDGLAVLEVGGGIGAVDIELLRAGAARATNLELSPSYEPVAERLALEAGVADRFTYRIGDLAEEDAEPADAVVMHRVLCCYPDGDRLLRAGARHARRALVITVPRDDVWWTRAGATTVNGLLRLLRLRFRIYLHPVAKLVGGAEDEGLRRVHDEHDAVWRTLAFER